MKRIWFLAIASLLFVGSNAQSREGVSSLAGQVGYQSDYERFGLGLQYRHAIMDHFRIAPDVTFFFPKDKVTGLDININFHYVFNFKADGQGLQAYPLVGVGMQNNFDNIRTVTFLAQNVMEERENTTDFVVNVGGGISLPLSPKSYLNAETRFLLGDKNSVVFMLGYGWHF